MEQINVCPSTLAEGYSTYSPAALRALFNGKVVSHILSFNSPNNEEDDNNDYAQHVGRISLSGVQPKVNQQRVNITPNIYQNADMKLFDRPKRQITEIRVFYDDQTWETFVPKK